MKGDDGAVRSIYAQIPAAAARTRKAPHNRQLRIYEFDRHSSPRSFFLGKTDLEDHLASQQKVAGSRNRRDVERTIEQWQLNAQGSNRIPHLDTFDFSPMRGDWGYRFLICGDQAVENSVFVIYGSRLAQLLGLPERAETTIPFVQQVPELYRDMFAEGYSKAITELTSVTLKGTFSHGSNFELFRAVFLPIILHPGWSKQLIFGSFNCRAVTA